MHSFVFYETKEFCFSLLRTEQNRTDILFRLVQSTSSFRTYIQYTNITKNDKNIGQGKQHSRTTVNHKTQKQTRKQTNENAKVIKNANDITNTKGLTIGLPPWNGQWQSRPLGV